MSSSIRESVKSASLKRRRIDNQSDYYEEDSDGSARYQASQPKKRNASAQPSSSTAAASLDKSSKKAARMERNRQAAQASRDRKKHYTQELETRLQELESQLASSSGVVSSSISDPADQERIAQLEAENTALRSQLACAQSETLTVKQRLDGLEAKLELLTSVLSNTKSSSPTPFVSPKEMSLLPSPPSPFSFPLFDPTTLVDLLPAPIPSQAIPEEASSLMTGGRGNLQPQQQTLSQSHQQVNQVDPLVARERKVTLPRNSTLVSSLMTRHSHCLDSKFPLLPLPVNRHSSRNPRSETSSTTTTKLRMKNYQLWQKNLLLLGTTALQTCPSIQQSILQTCRSIQQQQRQPNSSSIQRIGSLVIKQRMSMPFRRNLNSNLNRRLMGKNKLRLVFKVNVRDR